MSTFHFDSTGSKILNSNNSDLFELGYHMAKSIEIVDKIISKLFNDQDSTMIYNLLFNNKNILPILMGTTIFNMNITNGHDNREIISFIPGDAVFIEWYNSQFIKELEKITSIRTSSIIIDMMEQLQNNLAIIKKVPFEMNILLSFPYDTISPIYIDLFKSNLQPFDNDHSGSYEEEFIYTDNFIKYIAPKINLILQSDNNKNMLETYFIENQNAILDELGFTLKDDVLDKLDFVLKENVKNKSEKE